MARDEPADEVSDPGRWGIDARYYPEGPDAGPDVPFQVREVSRASWSLNQSPAAQAQFSRLLLILGALLAVAVLAVVVVAVVTG
jgi:hypothetical protein